MNEEKISEIDVNKNILEKMKRCSLLRLSIQKKARVSLSVWSRLLKTTFDTFDIGSHLETKIKGRLYS